MKAKNKKPGMADGDKVATREQALEIAKRVAFEWYVQHTVPLAADMRRLRDEVRKLSAQVDTLKAEVHDAKGRG